MTLKSKAAISVVGLAALSMAAVAVAWFTFIDSDSPAPVSPDEALNSAAPATAPGAPSTDVDAPLQPVGEWRVVGGGASFAGYRVDQQVAGIGRETVVGRTPNVQGSLSFDGSAVTDARVAVDMTSLRSDQSLRDNVLRGEAIETGQFRTAEFTLTSPVAVPMLPAAGQEAAETLNGELTLHGVTRPLRLEVRAALQGDKLVVVGSQEILFEDFDIEAPRGPASVLSVEDHGVFEVQLVFERAA